MPSPHSDEYTFGYDWFGDKFDDLVFDCFETGDVWRIKNRISYKSPEILGSEICEACAVYTCEYVEGPDTRKEAIVKIYMQIPNVNFIQEPEASIDKQKFAYQAVKHHQSRACRDEIKILDRLTKANCSSTPRLLYCGNVSQDDTFWVPGGYIWLILQEKVPGIPLDQVWEPDNLSGEEKATIRDAFKAALLDIQSHHIEQCDKQSRNCMWDAKQKKCYMIDFENSEIVRDGYFTPLDNADGLNSSFLYWGLADEGTYQWKREWLERCEQKRYERDRRAAENMRREATLQAE